MSKFIIFMISLFFLTLLSLLLANSITGSYDNIGLSITFFIEAITLNSIFIFMLLIFICEIKRKVWARWFSLILSELGSLIMILIIGNFFSRSWEFNFITYFSYFFITLIVANIIFIWLISYLFPNNLKAQNQNSNIT